MFLFLPVRGIFNILTFNVEKNWEKDIKPYRVKGYIDIDLNQTSEIELKVIPSYFDSNMNLFTEPMLKIDFPCEPVMQNIENDSEFHRGYRRFIKNTISILLWFYVVMTYLLWKGISGNNIMASILVCILLLGMSCVTVGIIVADYKKKKKLLQSFKLHRKNRFLVMKLLTTWTKLCAIKHDKIYKFKFSLK